MQYTFECNKCHKRFEVRESLAEHERGREKCPECGSRKVEQKLAPAFLATSRKS
jgi:putative FmdB family regulatory protein